MDFPNLILTSQIVYFFCSMMSSRNPYLFMLSSTQINSGAQFLSSSNIETLNGGKTILALFRLYLEFP